MKNTRSRAREAPAAGTRESCNLSELVRGSEGRLLEQMTPLVCRKNVSLDLKSVERIDAAGIATLILLYRRASESGHSFTVMNAAPHVVEILKLVGLDRILLSHIVNRNSHSGFRMAQTTA
jgi:anti-anti-sigma factor